MIEEEITASRLDAVVEVVNALHFDVERLVKTVADLHAEVKRLADAATASHGDRTEQSGYLQEAEAHPPTRAV